MDLVFARVLSSVFPGYKPGGGLYNHPFGSAPKNEIKRVAVRVNGLTEIALTKLDVLSHFDSIKVATAYRSGDDRFTEMPRQQRVLYTCTPEYEEVEGWGDDISDVTDFGDLPKAAQAYVELVEEIAGVPISTVSVGPSRAATLTR